MISQAGSPNGLLRTVHTQQQGSMGFFGPMTGSTICAHRCSRRESARDGRLAEISCHYEWSLVHEDEQREGEVANSANPGAVLKSIR